jgi:hypothetical protein
MFTEFVSFLSYPSAHSYSLSPTPKRKKVQMTLSRRRHRRQSHCIWPPGA